ncbi:MAG: hypothetical protein GVY34_06400 [Alphaproteobacteria bacterium]|jgi:hypothetical protein|nr:hypothetical protein [Alphaproteobacteria bacterium]
MSEKTLNFLLKELELCNAEIARRSGEQFKSVIAALISIGTIIGLVSEFADSLVNLLAAIPWIHAVLGFIWVDHSYAIFRQGEYIRRIIEPEIRINIDNQVVGHLKFVGDMRVKARRFSGKPSIISQRFPLIFFITPSFLSILAFIIYHIENWLMPDVFAFLLMGVSILFTWSLVTHWKFSNTFINNYAAEEL